MMKTVFLLILLISCISCSKFRNRHSRVRRSAIREKVDRNHPDLQFEPITHTDHKTLPGVLESSPDGKLETFYRFVEQWLQKGNVTLVGWQKVEDEDGNKVIKTIEFTLDHGDAPTLQSGIMKNLEYETINDLSEDIVNVHRRTQSETGMNLLASFEKYYHDGILDAKLYIDNQDSFYSEDNEVNVLKRNLTVETYSEADELAKKLNGTYEKINIIGFNRDGKFLPEYSQIVPELMGEVADQTSATLEQMEAALTYSVKGYLKGNDSLLEYVGKQFDHKFPEYSWHVVNGSPYTYMNKDVTIQIFLDEDDYSLSIFGDKI